MARFSPGDVTYMDNSESRRHRKSGGLGRAMNKPFAPSLMTMSNNGGLPASFPHLEQSFLTRPQQSWSGSGRKTRIPHPTRLSRMRERLLTFWKLQQSFRDEPDGHAVPKKEYNTMKTPVEKINLFFFQLASSFSIKKREKHGSCDQFGRCSSHLCWRLPQHGFDARWQGFRLGA